MADTLYKLTMHAEYCIIAPKHTSIYNETGVCVCMHLFHHIKTKNCFKNSFWDLRII